VCPCVVCFHFKTPQPARTRARHALLYGLDPDAVAQDTAALAATSAAAEEGKAVEHVLQDNVDMDAMEEEVYAEIVVRRHAAAGVEGGEKVAAVPDLEESLTMLCRRLVSAKVDQAIPASVCESIMTITKLSLRGHADDDVLDRLPVSWADMLKG
jgi:hypothetical protein